MAISDDTILTLAKEMGANTQATRELTLAITTHVVDPQAHSGTIPRLASLEASRRRLRLFAMSGVGVPTTAGVVGAKMGWLAGLLSALKDTGAPHP